MVLASTPIFRSFLPYNTHQIFNNSWGRELVLLNLQHHSELNIIFICYSVIGGLLSAHLLAVKAGVMVDDVWPCKGPLLKLAVDVAERLLPGK